MSYRSNRQRASMFKRSPWKPVSGTKVRRARQQMLARNIQGPVVRLVSKAVPGENKYFDVADASYEYSTTGVITHLDVITQGDSVNQRNGRKFMPTSLNFRGYVSNKSTSNQTDNALIILWDKQPNKALAAITDVLDAVNTTAQNKRENAQRFQIIRRWNFHLTGKSDGTTTAGYAQSFDEYVRLPKGLVAQCTPADTTGAIGNRVSGALLMIHVGNNATGNSAAVGQYSIRVGFQEVN